jgi:hypothetical protein
MLKNLPKLDSEIKSISHIPEKNICSQTGDVDCKYCSPIIDLQVRRASNIFSKKLVVIRETLFLGFYCNNGCLPCDELKYCPKRYAASKKHYNIKSNPSTLLISERKSSKHSKVV